MNNRKTILLTVVAVACVGLIYFFSRGADEKKRYSWKESYLASSAQPYGTSFLVKMMEDYRPEGEFIFNTKEPVRNVLRSLKEPEATDYILVGPSIHLDRESIQELAKFLDAGGNAFIASLSPPKELLGTVYINECEEDIEYDGHLATSITANFFHPDLADKGNKTVAYRIVDSDTIRVWPFLDRKNICDAVSVLSPLGYEDPDRINFFRIKVGKGNLFLHTDPILFTNYYLTDEKKLDYVSAVFSHLDGKHIIWDEFSKVSLPEDSFGNPLYYLLSQPSLKYAWWLLLVTVMIYVAFAAKRKQRFIPVLEPKRNTSLEFVNIIAMLHYRNGNHLDMAHKKMKYFLYFVRSRYGINAEKFNEEQIRRISDKSQVDLADVQSIFSRYHLIETRFKHNIEEARLADLYDSINRFYKHCK